MNQVAQWKSELGDSHNQAGLRADLPRVEIVHDLPESEKICAHHGTALGDTPSNC